MRVNIILQHYICHFELLFKTLFNT